MQFRGNVDKDMELQTVYFIHIERWRYDVPVNCLKVDHKVVRPGGETTGEIKGNGSLGPTGRRWTLAPCPFSPTSHSRLSYPRLAHLVVWGGALRWKDVWEGHARIRPLSNHHSGVNS